MVHANTALPHKAAVLQRFMTQTAMAIAAHHPYSPNLAPSDFYLFGHVKFMLKGELFETGERLLPAVEVIFGSVEKWL
jgi:hypothetical protein